MELRSSVNLSMSASDNVNNCTTQCTLQGGQVQRRVEVWVQWRVTHEHRSSCLHVKPNLTDLFLNLATGLLCLNLTKVIKLCVHEMRTNHQHLKAWDEKGLICLVLGYLFNERALSVFANELFMAGSVT